MKDTYEAPEATTNIDAPLLAGHDAEPHRALGPLSRDEKIAFGGIAAFAATVAVVVSSFGLAGLGVMAVLCVPVIFTLLMMITVGR